MPRHHNFVANGLLVHNSIEQDADLVMMIYRPEYYDPNTSDRGIAEVIIAKHRNGPTGTVRLLFESQYTQFRNLADPTAEQPMPKRDPELLPWEQPRKVLA
jgi:replicative DNA helicase